MSVINGKLFNKPDFCLLSMRLSSEISFKEIAKRFYINQWLYPKPRSSDTIKSIASAFFLN